MGLTATLSVFLTSTGLLKEVARCIPWSVAGVRKQNLSDAPTGRDYAAKTLRTNRNGICLDGDPMFYTFKTGATSFLYHEPRNVIAQPYDCPGQPIKSVRNNKMVEDRMYSGDSTRGWGNQIVDSCVC
jgi:hypothetical protein